MTKQMHAYNMKAETNETYIISEEAMQTFLMILNNIFNPIVVLLGTMGNSLSIIILIKHGFGKSSNIILFVLAVMDVSTLITKYGIPELVYIYHGEYSFRFNKLSSRVWFAFYQINRVLNLTAFFSGYCIPSVITLERLVAVFLPLRFPQIVTPFRTWLALGILYTLWFIKFLHSSFFHFYLDYSYDPVLNASVGRINISPSFYEQLELNEIVTVVVKILGANVPAGITGIGCLVITIKLRINAHKRKKMTSSEQARSNSQTTKTLLAVCFIYIFGSTYDWISNLPPIRPYKSVQLSTLTNLGTLISQIDSSLFLLNNSVNFVIYVGLNKKFRDTFKSLFFRPVRGHSKRQ